MNQHSPNEKPPRVLLLEAIHEDAARIFHEQGYRVERAPASLSGDGLLEAIRDVTILGVRSKTAVTDALLTHAPRLLAVGAYCIGTDGFELRACSKRGVAVFNAPYGNTRSVVELTLGEIVMLMRRTFERSTLLHAGEWRKSSSGAHEVRGKRLGIIGYGNIGSQLSVLAESLGMKVLYFDIVEKLALGNAVKCDSMGELLRRSDVVTVHVDGRPENRNLIGADEFAAMQDGAVFLNSSRGFVIDVPALKAALDSGRLAGAALDVFPREPAANGDTFVSELRGLRNVILTPHVGGSTSEAQRSIARYVSERLAQYVGAGDSYGSVNFPNIRLGAMQDVQRFLHVHENVPGILAQINGALADSGINVEGQYLKTMDEIGYVITDVGARYDEAVKDRLRSIEGTIRFRVLQ